MSAPHSTSGSSSSSGRGPPSSHGPPPVVAGYTLVRVLGRGGMGVVWEATEHRLDRNVALKVCASGGATPEHAYRLWSEARLAAKIGHPGVVPVHDFGYTVDGRPYYTMELVEGTELRAVLRGGALPIQRALTLALEIAEAVAAAHDRGILHRDLKPGNVLVDAAGRARILDFGLAVPHDDPRQQDPRLMAGSPPYMAPERFQQQLSTAATDVYAIGVVLYEMLTGERPFNGADVYQVYAAVLTQEAPRPSSRKPEVRPELEDLVMRCLAKEPTARFANARELATALRAILEGRPIAPPASAVAAFVRPRKPPPPPRFDRRAGTPYIELAIDLRASPEALWPHVANTDRFNRAAGLAEVLFADTPAEGGGSTTTGSFRTLGMNIAWQEHPFEWVKDREHSVYREYTSGPLKALWNRVALEPRADGGTRLVHDVRAITSGVVGRLAAQFELGTGLVRRFEEIYRRVDGALAEGRGFSGDPFEPPHTPTSDEQARVAHGVERLIERSGFDPKLAARLSDLLLYAPDKMLERLRPFALADAWPEDREATLDLLLAAAGAGLLELAWDLVCPRCQVPHEVASTLERVSPRGVCGPCNAAYEADLSSSVELVFRPHPSVRAVAIGTYCIGAPSRRPHVVAQQALAPGEARAISVALAPGTYRVTGPLVAMPRELTASPVGWTAEITLVAAASGAEVTIEVTPAVVRAGEVRVEISNDTEREQVLRIETTGGRADAVTAAVALAHPRFRELFSSEVLAQGAHVAVSRAAFLFLDVPDRFSLLEEKGDAAALAVATRLDAIIAEHAGARGGSVVEAGSDLRQTLAFASAAHAVGAALAILNATEADSLGVNLRASVHEGRCLAMRRGDRVEWFGETLARGAALLDEVREGGIALSFRVAEDRDALLVLTAAQAQTEIAEGSSHGYGARRMMRVYRRHR